MINIDARGQGAKGAKSSLNVKPHPYMMLGIANFFDERYSGGKGAVTKHIVAYLLDEFNLLIH